MDNYDRSIPVPSHESTQKALHSELDDWWSSLELKQKTCAHFAIISDVSVYKPQPKLDLNQVHHALVCAIGAIESNTDPEMTTRYECMIALKEVDRAMGVQS